MQDLQEAKKQVPQLPMADSNMSRQTKQSLSSIEAVIFEIVMDLVGQDVSIDAPLAGQGLDSLAAMELRQRLQAIFSLLTARSRGFLEAGMSTTK